LFARIAPELYLKRLVVGGFEKVYELNRNFRNEGISAKHNPEFTMLEFYMAYADVNQMMDFAERLLRSVVNVVSPSGIIRYGEHEIDFSQPFQRMTMREAIATRWGTNDRTKLIGGGVDRIRLDGPKYVQELVQATKIFENRMVLLNFDKTRLASVGGTLPQSEERYFDGIREKAEEVVNHPSFNPQPHEPELSTIDLGIEYLFEYAAESSLIQPTFITDFPKGISPLSKASPSDPSVAERFEFFVGGLETANGFSELNDPEEQYQRFKDQVQRREGGDEEAMVMDEDYIRALSYGMPPAAGIGVGIDRLVMLLANKHSIRDVILFPHLRPEQPGQ
jgi:lysyl-tRNA synthetase class 2